MIDLFKKCQLWPKKITYQILQKLYYLISTLGMTASSALVGLILEIGIIYLMLTIMSINTSLTKWDILSFSSYKYVGIIAVLISGLLLNTKGYYLGLVYVSVAFIFFLLRTLKLRIEPEVNAIFWRQLKLSFLIFTAMNLKDYFENYCLYDGKWK